MRLGLYKCTLYTHLISEDRLMLIVPQPISDEHILSCPIFNNIFFSKSVYVFRDIFTLPKKAQCY